MLSRAETRLEISIDSEDERVALDASKFIAKTLGKDEGYSDRTEHTGKDGKDLIPEPLLGGNSNKNYVISDNTSNEETVSS